MSGEEIREGLVDHLEGIPTRNDEECITDENNELLVIY